VHGLETLRKWEWPLVPLLLEAFLAIVWCHVLVAATLFWALSASYGIPNLGNTLIIGQWGTMAVGVALGQVFWGIRLDSHHDKTIVKLWPLAPMYPIVYWWLGALAVVWTTIPTLLTRPTIATWSLTRRVRNTAVRDLNEAF
jgi:hypothetical protein